MEEHELASDSDSSDEDYVPQGAAEPVSEEDSGAEVDEGPPSDEENNSAGRKKRGKSSTKKARKKIKTVEEPKEDEESESTEKPLSAEEEKKRADSLWADFMKDCGPPAKRPISSTSTESESTDKIIDEKENKSETPVAEEQPKKVKITQIFEFAGEKVEVEKEVAKEEAEKTIGVAGKGGPGGRGRGISSVLAMIGKKGKLSTLEKSKLDWDKFKSQEGISEQLQSHNKGRNGYLEKQDFLQRADLRQFEIEKEMRSTRRSKR